LTTPSPQAARAGRDEANPRAVARTKTTARYRAFIVDLRVAAPSRITVAAAPVKRKIDVMEKADFNHRNE